MRHMGTVLAALGAAGCWFFCAAYWWKTRGDWTRTPVGWHLMLFTADLGLLLSLAVVGRVWPDYPGRTAVTNVFFAFLVVQIYWRIVLLYRAQQ